MTSAMRLWMVGSAFTRPTLLLLATSSIASLALAQQAVGTVNDRRPDALVDLRTDDGLRLVGGAWRYSDASIVPADFREPGPDLRPGGAPLRTFDIAPRAGAAAFDDSQWPIVGPTTLHAAWTLSSPCCCNPEGLPHVRHTREEP